MEDSFASAVVILLLVTDPIGNIPLFVSLLRHVDPDRRVRVIVRECAMVVTDEGAVRAAKGEPEMAVSAPVVALIVKAETLSEVAFAT